MLHESYRQTAARLGNSLPWFVFGICLLHRLVQLYLLWPGLTEQTVRDDHIMQLLPAAVWRDQFAAGLLYLQQAPPLPNLVFGLLAWCFHDATHLGLAMLGLQIVIAGASAALLCRLLMRFHLPGWLCLAAPLVLFLSGDLISMEYNMMGHFFYEQGTMLLCVLACHSALSYQDSGRLPAALSLGLWVALLALTRSTFSYFAVPALVWLLLVTPQRRWLAAVLFLVPVLLLHGGWVGKNRLVHGYWSMTTSTWGGANARTGDFRRSGGDGAMRWMQEQEPFCEAAWWQMVQSYHEAIFFFPSKEWVLSFPQPEAVVEANRRMEEARGEQVFFDTATIRLYSQCLQRVYLRYWLHHPLETLQGAWRSYQVFWLPIREFAARNPLPVAPPAIQEENRPRPLLWLKHAVGEFKGGGYRQADVAVVDGAIGLVFKDIRVLALPFLPLALLTIFLPAFHLAVFYLCGAAIGGRLRFIHGDWWRLGFPVLCVAYVAALSSLVEYGENMRFRLEVEPLIWLVSLVALARLFYRWPPSLGGLAGRTRREA